MTTRLIIAAVAATASLAVAACGGGGSPSSTSKNGAGQQAAMRKAMLSFAKCMRQHGVAMEDPKFSAGGGVQMTNKSKPGGEATMRAAEQACKKYQDAIKPPTLSAANKEKFRKEALANARCMREHGINMPDPTFAADGGASMRLDKRSGVNPSSPAFQAAQKVCMKSGGGFGVTQAGGK
jgi:hypothetical protein